MKSFLKWFSILGLALVVIVVGTFAVLYWWAAKDLPSIEKITDYDPPLATTVYTSQKDILGYFFKEKRFLRRLENMSAYLPKAFIAAEDKEFRQHPGVDFTSIIRAAIANLKAGNVVQGGSTITQQVIDTLLMDTGTNYFLKLKEAILAYRLDKNLSKDEILTIYLNHIYLGEGTYGVEAAARTYFGKHVNELSLAEAALIAGLPRAPSLYNPYQNPKAGRSRQRYVLRQMRQSDVISEKEYNSALKADLNYHHLADPTWSKAGYYLQTVRKKLIKKFDRDTVYRGGLKVYTSLSMAHHKSARRSLRQGLQSLSKRRGWHGPVKHLAKEGLHDFIQESSVGSKKLQKGSWIKVGVTKVNRSGATVRFGDQKGFINVDTMAWARNINPDLAPNEIPKVRDARQVLDKGDIVYARILSDPGKVSQPWDLALEQRPKVQGGLVSLDPDTGQVKALIGGYSFSDSQFNRATQAKRQPGSAFKPVVYSQALEKGYTAASQVLDAPVVMQANHTGANWKPRNYSLDVQGKILFRTGLVHSINLATIRLARKIGVDSIIQQARQLGFQGPFPGNLTLSIGSLGVSLMHLCRAYTAFARDGTIIDPILITRVTDPWGKELFRSDKKTQKATSPQISYILTYLLKQAVQDGTGWRVKKLGRPVAGKTGTTNNQKDAWFIGYTPDLLTGVYVGFDNTRSMGKYETGSRAASPIWLHYRQAIKDLYPVQESDRPQGIVMAKISARTGLLAGPKSDKTCLLPFREGNQPQKIADSKESKTGLLKQIF